MDLEMPVLDGYKAAKLIRDPSSEYYNPKIPIIALTANAFKETKEKCFEIGMNDFLTKPISLDSLLLTLNKFYNFKEEPQNKNTMNCVDFDAALKRLNFDKSLYRKACTSYIEKFNMLFSKLDNAISEKNFEVIYRESHSLKSVSGAIGATRLSSIAQTMENIAKENKTEYLEENYNYLLEENELVIQTLKKYFLI